MPRRPEMLKILLIDDNLDDRLLVVRQLNQAFENIQIDQIVDQQSFDQALTHRCFDIAITDYHLIWSTGLEVLKQLKTACPDCPVIMFTNTATQENAVEAMKAGLDDYIIKSPRHYIRLASAVRLVLERAEDRRKASHLEMRLQSLLNHLSVGVFRSTLDGQLLEANAAFLELLGLESLEAAQVVNLNDLFQSQMPSQPSEPERAIGGRELQLQRTDGTPLWLSLNQTITTQGRDCFVEGLIEDISRRKDLEDILHQKAEELATANRLKDEFLATIYHELRSPLNSILGWSKLLRTQKVINPGMVERALEVIERNAVAQTRVVEDILDVSKIIQGKLRLQVAPVNLSTVIHAAVEVVYPAAAAKSIAIQITLDPLIEPVLGDANRLQQVIWNLLSNAVRFTPLGGQIEITLKRRDRYAQLTVSDTGIGISADFLPYVFDRFRQADGSTTRRYGGMGLGLSIVRHLVELHGGLAAATSPGLKQGATFTVEIPLMVQSSAQFTPSAPLELGWLEMTEFRILEGLKILLIEDETDDRQLIELMLGLCGAVVFAVPSPEAATELMQAFNPDLLISDSDALEPGSTTLTGRMQGLQAQATEWVPAIILVASSEDLTPALDTQVCLAKPILPETLVRAIVQLTGRDGRGAFASYPVAVNG